MDSSASTASDDAECRPSAGSPTSSPISSGNTDFPSSRSIPAPAIAGCTIRSSTTTATIRRCCSASTRRSRCRSRMATPKRAASRWRHRPQRRRPAARDHGHLLRLYRPRAGLRHRRDRADGRGQAPSARRLGAHRERAGHAVRDYVKWDYQPGGIEGVPDSFARAYSIMMTEPQGPIYMCYDAGHAGGAASKAVALPDR